MVTADGLETNIGNRCGFKKFGVQYQRIKNAAIASDRRERNRQKIRTALAERDQFYSTIEALLSAPHGAKWLAKVKADFERKVPSEACYMIRKMAREGMPSVYTARLRSGKEMELQRELHGSGKTHVSRYALDQVGTLTGLDFWIHDLRGLLIDQLQMKMRALEGEAVQSLTEVRLRQYAGWLDEVPFKITEAQRLIGEGAKFFNPANLNLIKYLSTDERKIEGLTSAIDAMLPLVR
ncbi:hypothetical protein PQQ99_28095 [Paraburkholderia sediminicola]|uniref:hypothetical protein n=1 Tax=Paraburkholderia sediminicola TaxID=458836 RepID=UPI0038B799F3